jgi:arsenate reductase (thioredoxin)
MKILQKGISSQALSRIVLFLSPNNAGRSQMAEGFFRKYAPRGYITLSAAVSSTKTEQHEISPLAKAAMLEYGIDIGNQKVKRTTENMIRDATIIIYIGFEYDKSETLSTRKVIRWNIHAIRDNSLDEARKISDEIEKKVRGTCSRP